MLSIRSAIALPACSTLLLCCFASTTAEADPPPARNVCEAQSAAMESVTRSRPFAYASLERTFAAPRLPRLRGRLLARPTAPSVATGAADGSNVELEVRDSAPGHKTKIERFTVPLTDGQVSELESRVEDQSFKVKIFRAHDRPLSFELWRDRRTPDASKSEAKLSTSLRMKKGEKAVIARIDHADGHQTVVVATLR